MVSFVNSLFIREQTGVAHTGKHGAVSIIYRGLVRLTHVPQGGELDIKGRLDAHPLDAANHRGDKHVEEFNQLTFEADLLIASNMVVVVFKVAIPIGI